MIRMNVKIHIGAILYSSSISVLFPKQKFSMGNCNRETLNVRDVKGNNICVKICHFSNLQENILEHFDLVIAKFQEEDVCLISFPVSANRFGKFLFGPGISIDNMTIIFTIQH